MGLIYSSGDSSALMTALSANLTAATSTLESTASACDQLEGALGGGELSGQGYSAVDNLFSQIIKPSISDAKIEIDAIQSDLDSYTQADSLVSQYGDLNEDDLNTQLTSVKAQRDATESQIETNRKTAALSASMPMVGASMDAANANLELVLSELEGEIKELEDKQQALRSFDAQTSGAFVDGIMNLAAVAGDVVSLLDKLKSPGGFDAVFAAGGAIDIAKVRTYLAGRELTKSEKVVLPSQKNIRNMQNRRPDLPIGRTYRYLSLGGTVAYERNERSLSSWGEKLNKGAGVRIDSYRQPLKAGLSGARGAAIDTVRDFGGWKGASTLTKLGKGAGIAGTVLTVGANANDYFHDGVQGTDVRDFAVDTTVDLAAGAAAVGVGAAVGSLVLPPVGTALGALAGLVFNAALNWDVFGGKSLVDLAKDGIKGIGDWIGSTFW